jgi:LysR family transcriptional regulator for metE and metH
MREAEARMGVSLVERHGRLVRLTPAGRYLAEAAGLVETQLAEAEATAGLIDNGRLPRLTVGLDFFDTAPWLITLLSVQHAPPVDIIRIPVNGAVTAIRGRAADLIVTAMSNVPWGVASRDLGEDHLVAVVPSTSPLAARRRVSVADMAAHPYLAAGFETQPGFELRELFGPAGIAPAHVTRIESLQFVLRLVAEGQGVTIQPSACVPAIPGIAVRTIDAAPVAIRWQALTAESPTAMTSALLDSLSFTEVLAPQIR